MLYCFLYSCSTKILSAFNRDILNSAYDKDNTYHIKDSCEVKDKVNRIFLQSDYVIAILDIWTIEYTTKP